MLLTQLMMALENFFVVVKESSVDETCKFVYNIFMIHFKRIKYLVMSFKICFLFSDNVKLVSPQQNAETESEDNVEEQQSEHKGVREETNFVEICSKKSKDDPLAPVLEAEKPKCNVEKSEGNLDDSSSLSDAESEVFDDIFLKTIKKELADISEDENCFTNGSDDCDASRTEGSISPTFDSTLLRYLDDTTRNKIENRELSSLATISAKTDDNNESDATIECPEEYNACLDRGLSCDELTRDAKEIINAIDIIEEPGSEPLHSESEVDSDENKTNASPVAVMHVEEDGSVETKDAVVEEGDVVVSKGSETESKQSLTPPSVLECADTNSSIPILDKMLDGKLTRHISTSCETVNSTGIDIGTSGDISNVEESEPSHCGSDKLKTDSEVKDKSCHAVILQNNNAVIARTLDTCAENDMDVDDAIEFIRKNVERRIGKRRKLSETEISETSETEPVTSNNVSNEELKQTITEYSSSFETSDSSFEDTVSFENHNSPFVPLCEGLLPSVEHELQKKEDNVNNNGKEHDECRCSSNKHTSTENEYIAFNDDLSTISQTRESVENTYKTLHSAVVASKMEGSNDLSQSCVINEDTSLTSTDNMKVSKPLGCKTLLAKEQPALVSNCLPLSKAIELVQEYPQTCKVPVSDKLTNEKTKPCGKSDSEVKTCVVVEVVNPVQTVEESTKDPLPAKHSMSQVHEASGLGKEIMAPTATEEPNLDEDKCQQMVTQDMSRIKDSAIEDSEICNTFRLEKEGQNLSTNCNEVVPRDTATVIQELDTGETLDSKKEVAFSDLPSNEVSPKTDDLDIGQTSEVTRGFELKDAIMESSRATDSQNQLQNDVQDDELSKSLGVQLEFDNSGDVKETGRNITKKNIATGLKSDLQVSNQRSDSVKRENVELPSEELRINDEEIGKPSFNAMSAMTSNTNENFIEESQVESQGTGLGPDSVLADGSEKEINDDPNSCLSNAAFIEDENKEMADTVELSDLATTAGPAETPQVTKNHTMPKKEGHSVSGVIDTPPIIAMQAAEAETKADVEKKENLQSESSLSLSSKSNSQLAELKVPKEQRSDDFTGLGGPGHENNASNRTNEDSLAHEPMEYFNNKLEHDLLFTNEFKGLTIRNERNLGQGKKQKDTEVTEATAVLCQYLESHQSCSVGHLLLDILTKKKVDVPGKVEHIKAKDLIKNLPITQLPFHDGFMKDSDCSLTELEESSAQNLITKASQLSDNEQDISSLESSDVEMTVLEMQGELRNDPEMPSTGLNSVRVGKDTSLTPTEANGRQISYNVFNSLELPGQKSGPEMDKISTQSTFSELHKLTDNLVSTHEGDISQTSGQEHKIESSPCQSLVQKSSLSNSEETAVDNRNAFCEESAEISNNKKELSENKNGADLSKNNKAIPLNGTYLSKVSMDVFKNNCEVSSNNKALLVNNVVSMISKGKVKTRKRGRLPKQARQIPDVQDDVFDKKVKRRSPRQRKLRCDEVFDLLCGSNLSSRELPYDPNMFKASSGKGLARRESFVKLETELRAGGKDILELDPEQVIDILAISEDDDEFFLQLDISSEEGSIVSELTQRTTPSVGSSSLPLKPCNARSATVAAPKITKECCPSGSTPHRMESLVPVATDISRTNRTSGQSVPNRTPRRGRPRNRDEHFRKKRYGNDSKVGCIDIPALVGSLNQKTISKSTVKKSPLQISGQCSEALNVSTSSEGCASVAASKECELSASTSSEVYSRLVSNKGDLSASTSGAIHTGLGGPKASAVSIPTNCSAPALAPNSADACGSTPTSQLTPNIQNVSRQTSSSTEKVCSSACTLNIQESSSLSQNDESPGVSSGESLKVTLVSETDPLTGRTNWTTNYGKPTEAMKVNYCRVLPTLDHHV